MILLKCEWDHYLPWPDDLTPPRRCPAKIAESFDRDHFCHQPMAVTSAYSVSSPSAASEGSKS